MSRHTNAPLVRTGLMALGLLAFILLWHPGNARAACQVKYTGKAAQMFGSAPRGNFSSLADCNNYIRNSAGFERANSHCVGSCGSTSGKSSGSSGLKPGQALAIGILGAALESALSEPAGPSPEEIARKQAEEEAARQEAQRRAEEEARRLAEAKEKRLVMAQNMKPMGDESATGGSRLAWKGIDVDMTPPTAASAITPGSGTNTAKISTFSRMACAQSLSDAASQYADRGGQDAAEKTRFYAEQARKALAGERLEVECPVAGALPIVPEPTGIERVYPGEGTIKELKEKARVDLGSLETVRAKKRELSERKAAIEAKKKEAEETISKPPESAPAVDTLKAEAEALLRQSESELAEITKDTENLEKEEAHLNDNLKRYQTAANKLEAK